MPKRVSLSQRHSSISVCGGGRPLDVTAASNTASCRLKPQLEATACAKHALWQIPVLTDSLEDKNLPQIQNVVFGNRSNSVQRCTLS